ncbi:hypothetical protein [Desulfovibrio ferrophilus]|uniref:Putative lipoprotein n=1 Tax=Desulfovibrio ferrophilus TaxID=241368 RepID=A0A2Z6B1J1_9BACT|nr:hypothetical protein [Desulfovibrio ferrophilus]BBD09389.1 putative lipoprotein [Desulfovibrio ferrophilus]
MHKIFMITLAMVSLLVLGGCESALQSHGENAPAKSTQSMSKPVGMYQEFDDVLIPNDMDLDNKASFVFETPQFKTGIVTYKGRVDAVSLANFFEKELPKDNWRLRSKMKYNRTIMVFEKPDRDCIINIIDETFNTIVEIMVAPRQDSGAVPQEVRTAPMEENLPQ